MIDRFSIIIVHRNGKDLIDHCLRTLGAVVTDQDEVFVVDNGSTDDSVQHIKNKYPSVTVIENTCNNGFAAANNQAIVQAKGTYCLLLNNDATLADNTLDRFAELFAEHQDIAVITPQLISSNGEEQRSFGYFMRPLDEITPKAFKKRILPPEGYPLVDVDFTIGACMAVRQSAIQQVGQLDDDFFFYFEEVFWCHCFKEQGLRVVLDKETKVIHEKGESTRFVRKEAQLELLRSRFLYYKKAFGAKTAFLLTTYRVFRLLVNFLFSTLFLLITLGIPSKTRHKFINYGYQVLWIFLGKPRHWGLPDKCSIGYGQAKN